MRDRKKKKKLNGRRKWSRQWGHPTTACREWHNWQLCPWTCLEVFITQHILVGYVYSKCHPSLLPNSPSTVSIQRPLLKLSLCFKIKVWQKSPADQKPTLFSVATKGKASIFAVFWGQGTDEVYFDDLQAFHCSLPLLHYPSSQITCQEWRGYHLLYIWIQHHQMAQQPFLMTLCSALGLCADLISLDRPYSIDSVSCHMQSSQTHSLKAICMYFWHDRLLSRANIHCGLHGILDLWNIHWKPLQSFEMAVLFGSAWPASIPCHFCGAQSCSRFSQWGEGVSSPILSITGLNLHDVKSYITKTNAHLSSNSHLYISLHNGPCAFVITWPACTLHSLVNSLRKVHAPRGLD